MDGATGALLISNTKNKLHPHDFPKKQNLVVWFTIFKLLNTNYINKKYVQFLCWNPKTSYIYIYINPLQKEKHPLDPPTPQLVGSNSSDGEFSEPPRYLDGVSFSDRLFWLFLTESVVFKGTSSLWRGVQIEEMEGFLDWMDRPWWKQTRKTNKQ